MWSPSPELFRTQDGVLAVGVGFARLGNLNPLEGTFEALFKLRLAYCEPTLRQRTERLNSTEGADDEGVGHWSTWQQDCPSRPTISDRCFANSHELQFVEFSSVRLEHRWGDEEVPGLVYMDVWIRGTFYEYFELEDFPYDVQKLSIRVRSTMGRREYHLVPWPKKTGFEVRCQLPDFSFVDPALIELSDETCREGKPKDHQVVVTVLAKRQPRFYEVNVMLMVCVLTTISFVTLWMNQDGDLGNNIMITLTLILTIVAFRFSISAKLPTVSYMTVLDKYFMVCFLLLMMIVINVLMCAVKVPKEIQLYADIFVGGFWILFNFVFVTRRCLFLRALTRELGKLSLEDLPAGESDDRVVRWKIL
mmetsp:Transcript_45089/g.119665  ORF Transcript_45089/g.119665 Transcript_45089/m.119665 type:complete len:363 (-) Transcript_45089:279-1367(-)